MKITTELLEKQNEQELTPRNTDRYDILGDEIKALEEEIADYEAKIAPHEELESITEGMTRAELSDFRASPQYAALSEELAYLDFDVYVFNHEDGFGPSVDFSPAFLIEYFQSNTVGMGELVKPEEFPFTDSKFEDRVHKLYAVIEIEGQTYAIDRDAIATIKNPEHEALPSLPVKTSARMLSGGYDRGIPDTLFHKIDRDLGDRMRAYTSRERLTTIFEEQNLDGTVKQGDPLGSYLELSESLDPHRLFVVREINDATSLLTTVANTFEERGIDYPKDLLLSGVTPDEYEGIPNVLEQGIRKM